MGSVAPQVFLMDPWWNPAVEQQAQDRIHRLGQYKPIQYDPSVLINLPLLSSSEIPLSSDTRVGVRRVTRFVIENTIEERILKLQEKKQLVFEG